MGYKEVDIEFLQQKIKDMEMETAKEVYALLEGMKIGGMETERIHPYEELEKIRREGEPYISEEKSGNMHHTSGHTKGLH